MKENQIFEGCSRSLCFAVFGAKYMQGFPQQQRHSLYFSKTLLCFSFPSYHILMGILNLVTKRSNLLLLSRLVSLVRSILQSRFPI